MYLALWDGLPVRKTGPATLRERPGSGSALPRSICHVNRHRAAPVYSRS